MSRLNSGDRKSFVNKINLVLSKLVKSDLSMVRRYVRGLFL